MTEAAATLVVKRIESNERSARELALLASTAKLMPVFPQKFTKYLNVCLEWNTFMMS